jgi:predicted phosphoribosyltransferase
MEFASRQDAGRRLGCRLRELAVNVDLVAGLPRGGVVVAAEVAQILDRPLDVIVVRKIGHPWHREFAVGALAEDGVPLFDHDSIAANPLPRSQLERIVAEETERLREYCRKFHGPGQTPLSGHSVLIVDDGLATGATAEAAVHFARARQARQIIMAAPVASTTAHERLARVADRVVTLHTDPDFCAVGQYYFRFLPTTDEEVLALLRQPHNSLPHAA